MHPSKLLCDFSLGSSWCSLGSRPTWQKHPFHLLYMSACICPWCRHVWHHTSRDLSNNTVACLSESHNYWIWNNPHFKIVLLFKILLFFPQQVWCKMLNLLFHIFLLIFILLASCFCPPPPDSSSSCRGKWRLLEPDIPRAGSHFGQQCGMWPGFHRSIYLHRIL